MKDARTVIIEYLTEHGPSTMAQIMEDTGLSKGTASTRIRHMLKGGAKFPRCIYIRKWVDTQEGARRYPRPVLSLGAGPNAKKPKPDPRIAARRWEQSRAKKLTQNFVFNMGFDPRRKR